MKMNRNRNSGKGLARDRRGAAGVLVGLMLMILLGAAALVIDMGYLWVLRNRLQATVDAAALAAASQLATNQAVVTAVPSCGAGVDAPSTVQAAALDYACKNMSSAAHGMVLDPNDVVLGNWDGDTRTFIAAGAPLNAVQITGRRSTANSNQARLFFAPILGIATTDITAASIAALKTGSMELALVLDVSGSMKNDMVALKDASQNLIDMLFGAAETLPKTWVSVIPFSGRVNILDYGRFWMQNWPSGDSIHLCVGLRSMPYQVNDEPHTTELFPDYVIPGGGGKKKKPKPTCPETKALGLTAEKSTIKNHIAAMTTTHGTSTQRGLVWGWRALSPKWKGEWGNAELPNPYNGPIPKVVVIMTDGVNHPEQSDDPYTVAEVDQLLLQECAAMKANGITIFSVVFKESSLFALYTACASPGKAFKATDAAALFAAFEQIAEELQTLKLVD